MASPTSSRKSSISSSESTGEFSSSETHSSEEDVLPVMKYKYPTVSDDINAENILWTKFFKKFSNNLPLKNLGKETIHELAEFLKNTPELEIKKFIITDSDIDAIGAKLLAEIIKSHKTITVVSLIRCNISGKGTKIFLDGIKENPECGIVNLNLNHNGIDSEGAKALAELLNTNISITKLILCANNIGDEGTKHLADAIQSNNTITTVVLNGNFIKTEGAKALAKLIKSSVTLTDLELTGNMIGAEGAKHLAYAIKTNPQTKIARLILRDCAMDGYNFKNYSTNSGLSALADAMESNSSIIDIDVAENIKSRDRNNKLDVEIIYQQSGINELKPTIEANIAAALDLLTQHPNPIDGNITSVRDVNDEIAKKLFLLDKTDKLISAKIRKNPNIVINKYT